MTSMYGYEDFVRQNWKTNAMDQTGWERYRAHRYAGISLNKISLQFLGSLRAFFLN